MQEGPVTKV